MLDVHFNVYSDTPKGKDPDSWSPTLLEYHKLLWSKNLPSKGHFQLTDDIPRKLSHSSELGTFVLSSDSIGHTYRYTRAIGEIVGKIDDFELNKFFSVCSTIGAYMVFPANKIDKQITINSARGFNRLIKDRFDLTLECIRLFYLGLSSPLYDTLNRYYNFFGLFDNFKGYVEYFLLQDMVSADFSSTYFWLPFNDFGKRDPLPTDVDEYRSYMLRLIDFITNRNIRILQYCNELNSSD